MKHPFAWIGMTVAIALAGGCYNAATSTGPFKVYEAPQYRGVHVVGTEVYLHTAGDRSRPACFGAYAIRQMVTFWDPEHKNRRDSRAIIETALVDSYSIGWRDEYPVFHLYAPLPVSDAE